MKVLCVAFILVVVGAQQYRRDKPGFCPRNDSIGPCINLCSSDDSCPGNLKCCRSGCGRSCMEPIKGDCSAVNCPRPSCSNPVRPPGQCCAVCRY
ncbi:waprin-Thr1-like [Dreissena polymorpha]|uniref:waprin-Thr1-like n=1 Tax=Dreissena polymorpha TaxID=45954 RepID=UPI002265615E|nr:waprin-Thr1-like [Dreissena polymorpha]